MNFPELNLHKMISAHLRKIILIVFITVVSFFAFSQEQLGTRLRYDFGGTIYGSVHQFSITDVYDGKTVTFFIKKEMNDVFSISYTDLHYKNFLAYSRSIQIGTAELHSTGFIRIIEDYITTLAADNKLNAEWEKYTSDIGNKISNYFKTLYPNSVKIAAIYVGQIIKDVNHIIPVMLVIDSIDASGDILNSYYMRFENNCFSNQVRLAGTLINNTLKLEDNEKINSVHVSMTFNNYNENNKNITGVWKDSEDNIEYSFILKK